MTIAEVAFLVAMIAIVHSIIMTISVILLDKDVTKLTEEVKKHNEQVTSWLVAKQDSMYNVGFFTASGEYKRVYQFSNEEEAYNLAKELNGGKNES